MPPKPSRLTQIEGGLPVDYSSPKTASWLRRLSFPEDELQFDPEEDLHAPSSTLKYPEGKPPTSPTRPHPLTTTRNTNRNASGLSPTAASSAFSGDSTHRSVPQTPTPTVGHATRPLHTVEGFVTPRDASLPSASLGDSEDGSAIPIPADSLCLGTVVHMATAALRPRALVATGIPYPLVDTHGVHTQFLSKQLSQNCFAAILELSQDLGPNASDMPSIMEGNTTGVQVLSQ